MPHLQNSTVDSTCEWWRVEIKLPLAIRHRADRSKLFRKHLPYAKTLETYQTQPYNPRLEHEHAWQEHDALLAPHGFFRALKPGDNQHAIEFLQKFGPLTLHGRIGQHITVDLGDFWRRQLRFRLVAQLWESRNGPEELKQAWLDVADRHKEASECEQVVFGSLPTGTVPLPFESNKEWFQQASFAEMRESALGLIHLELNLHVYDRQIFWERGWEPTNEKFRPVIGLNSLWSLIWEMFGLDTVGLSWRRCPHCQKIFYPRRQDQYYCTPKQQALASKREYARRRRAQERQSTHDLQPKGAHK